MNVTDNTTASNCPNSSSSALSARATHSINNYNDVYNPGSNFVFSMTPAGPVLVTLSTMVPPVSAVTTVTLSGGIHFHRSSDLMPAHTTQLG